MALLELCIALVLVALVIFIVTQIFYPMITGEPMFSIIRKSAVKGKISEAEHALETVAEVEHLKNVLNQINSRKAELDK
jgi:hypothetical protein